MSDNYKPIIALLLVVLIGMGLYIGSLRYQACRQLTNYNAVQCVLVSGR